MNHLKEFSSIQLDNHRTNSIAKLPKSRQSCLHQRDWRNYNNKTVCNMIKSIKELKNFLCSIITSDGKELMIFLDNTDTSFVLVSRHNNEIYPFKIVDHSSKCNAVDSITQILNTIFGIDSCRIPFTINISKNYDVLGKERFKLSNVLMIKCPNNSIKRFEYIDKEKREGTTRIKGRKRQYKFKTDILGPWTCSHCNKIHLRLVSCVDCGHKLKKVSDLEQERAAAICQVARNFPPHCEKIFLSYVNDFNVSLANIEACIANLLAKKNKPLNAYRSSRFNRHSGFVEDIPFPSHVSITKTLATAINTTKRKKVNGFYVNDNAKVVDSMLKLTMEKYSHTNANGMKTYNHADYISISVSGVEPKQIKMTSTNI